MNCLTKCFHQLVVLLIDATISLAQYLHLTLKSPSGSVSGILKCLSTAGDFFFSSYDTKTVKYMTGVCLHLTAAN